MDPSRSADRQLDDSLVADIVGDRFGFTARSVSYLGEGWVNEVFRVETGGGPWLFRFPKRADVVVDLLREIDLMPLFERSLDVEIPRFELAGTPGEDFPYPFVGYRPIEGVAADRMAAADPAGFARDLGLFLSQMHRIDPFAISPSSEGSWDMIDAVADLVEAAAQIWPHVPEDLRGKVEPYLSGDVRPPPFSGEPRTLYGDLCPDHVLVDETTGSLAGVIDFADADVGDPVLDLVGLISIGGWELLDRVRGHYTLSLDEGTDARLRFAVRVMHLRWLGQAAEGGGMTYQQRSDVDKHRAWVTEAFARGEEPIRGF